MRPSRVIVNTTNARLVAKLRCNELPMSVASGHLYSPHPTPPARGRAPYEGASGKFPHNFIDKFPHRILPL
jgi:hypothetical protein